MDNATKISHWKRMEQMCFDAILKIVRNLMNERDSLKKERDSMLEQIQKCQVSGM